MLQITQHVVQVLQFVAADVFHFQLYFIIDGDKCFFLYFSILLSVIGSYLLKTTFVSGSL